MNPEKATGSSERLPSYDELRKTKTLMNKPIGMATAYAARLVDMAGDRGSEPDLLHAVSLIEELREARKDTPHEPELSYFLANAWGALYAIRRTDGQSIWAWKQPEKEKALLYLRQAAQSRHFRALARGRQTQILTNTASLFSFVGRSFDAVRFYDRALIAFPGFGMALGNRAIAVATLAKAHYDQGQASLLFHRAYRDLKNSPKEHLDESAESGFREYLQHIEKMFPIEFLKHKAPWSDFKLGRSNAEQAYRTWALREGLFLNPMITLGISLAARDTLSLPSMVVPKGEGPGLLGLFTQIKQEYVSARFLAWEGLTATRRHFSDRETHLIDTLDYAAYGLALEKTKLAFRMAYSILDKSAMLLNKYFSLGIDDRKVNLNRIWFLNGDPKKGFNPAIVDTENWPLRGLFWIARDLFEKEDFADAVEPDAQELKSIRDHLEHKYLKVHEFEIPEGTTAPCQTDQYAKSISRDSLESKTITILRLACSAIMHLSLGIHSEEKRRADQQSNDGIILPIIWPTIRNS